MSVVPEGPLPRGRHGLSAEEVRGSQRKRIVHAMIELVAEEGYAGTTVPAVVARAQVSRNAFYALFADKVDCFIAVCDQYNEELLENMYGFAREGSWLRALDAGMEWYLRWWQAHPSFATTYFVEMPHAGPRALRERDRQLAQFARMFGTLAAWARHVDPALPPLPLAAPEFVTHGLTEVIGIEIRAGRLDRLGELRTELVQLAATTLGGPLAR